MQVSQAGLEAGYDEGVELGRLDSMMKALRPPP